MPSFRPSFVVNVRLKFDENLLIQPALTPETQEATMHAGADAGGSPAAVPLILRRGNENVSYVYGRIPKKASYELPGYRQAGQFSCDFDFRDMPIDPRTVRAASVEIHSGTISNDDFAQGMVGVDPALGMRRSILRTRDGITPDQSTLRMVGLVDEWGVVHGDSGSTVSFRGRDLRGILLDTPLEVLPGAAAQIIGELDWSQPINVVVQNLLANNPLFEDITVELNAAEWPNGFVPAPGAEGVFPRSRTGARGGRAGGRAATSLGSVGSFWDLIVRSCYLVGAIPYFQGRVLLIRPSHSIFDQQRAGVDPAIRTPFAGGRQRDHDAISDTALTPALSVRRLVYGRDILEHSFDRKFAGFARPRVVRCIGLDTSSTNRGQERLVYGRWPAEAAPEGARRTRVAPGGQRAQEEILNIRVPEVRDAERLTQMARAIYEEVGRGEMGGAVSTKNLSSFGGDNTDPDLLSLKPGDGVEFFVDVRSLSSGPPVVSTLTSMSRSSFEEAVADLTQRLGDNDLARVLVATARGQIQDLQRFFRVSTVRVTWDANTGVKIDFDFQNYVVARNQLSADTDVPDAGAATSVTVRRRVDQRPFAGGDPEGLFARGPLAVRSPRGR